MWRSAPTKRLVCFLLAVSVGCAVGGCATGARGSSRRMCSDAGFQPSTQAFTDCWTRIRDQQLSDLGPSLFLGVMAVAAVNSTPPAPRARALIETPRPQRQCVYWTRNGTRTLLLPYGGLCPQHYGD